MGGEVAEGEGLRVGEVVEGMDAMAGMESSVEIFEASDERVGDGLGSAPRDGPADAVGGGGEHEADGAAEGGFEGHERVRGESCEEGAGTRVMKVEVGKSASREHGIRAEARHEPGLIGQTKERTESIVGEAPPLAGEGMEGASPGRAVRAEMRGGAVEIAVEADGRAVVEGMGEWNFRVEPVEAKLFEVQ